MDIYRNFGELLTKEHEGRDFTVEIRRTASPFAIVAPHGGRIEPGTFTIASEVAGTIHSFYGFRGIKPSGNRMLHLTSSLFDDPRVLQIVRSVFTVITVHGCRGEEPMMYLGGKDNILILAILDSLRKAGLPVQPASAGNLRGCHPENLCNRGTSGKGVQLEISRGLRELLIVPLASYANRQKTPLFFALIEAISDVCLHVSRSGQRSL